MSNKLGQFARLVLCAVAFATNVYAQAVVPDPATLAPVINPPNPQTSIVISLGDYLTGHTPFEAMQQALTACQNQHAAKLVIPPGKYVFDDPKIPAQQSHIAVSNQSDLIIDGQGSEFVFHFPTNGFNFFNVQRVIVRNLIVDTDIQLASLGVVHKVGANTNIQILDAYPVTASTPVAIVAPYDIQNLKWASSADVLNPWEVYFPTNVTFVGPQTFSAPAFNSLLDGEGVVVEHHYGDGSAFAGTFKDLGIEDVTIYGFDGNGFSFDGTRGLRLSRCRVMQRPGTNRPVSTTANASNIRNIAGDILIEDCDFSGMGDDAVDLHVPWFQVTQKLDARTILVKKQIPNIPIIDGFGPGAVLRFAKPDSLTEYARANVTQVVFDSNTGIYTLTVDQDLPPNLAVNDLVINLSLSNHRFLVRRNYFHQHRGRGLVIESPDGVIENNRVKDTTYGSLQVFTETLYFGVGPGSENLIIRNNTFDGCGYGNSGTAGTTMGCIGISAQTPQSVPNTPVNKNILIDGNTISHTLGLAMFISSASGITVSNNVIINSNTIGAFPPWYGTNFGLGATPHGSIMVTKASNVLITGNLQLTTPQQTEKGVFVDALATGVTSPGYYMDPLPANVIDDPRFYVRQHYLDFLGRFPDLSGWDFWNNEIASCGTNQQCIDVKRVNVSGAYFLSIEFQQTGNLVYRMYKAGFGNLAGKPVAVDRASFMADTRQIQSTPAQVIVGQGNWQAQLEANKQAFALAFVQRAAFQAAHAAQDASTYVGSLFQKAGVTPAAAETSAAINAFNNAGGGDAGRASALRSVCESNSVSTKLFNEAFVLMQYFGYLQRNPYDPPEPTLDYQGFNFWLTKLNQFNGDYLAAEMVKAFIASSEYRQRFGP